MPFAEHEIWAQCRDEQCGSVQLQHGDLPCILQVGPKRRRLQEDNDILGPVQHQVVQESTLVQQLHEYVERIDTDMVISTHS